MSAPERMNANITHSFYYSSAALGTAEEFVRLVKIRVPGAVLYDPEADQPQPYLRDLRTAEKFLHGGGQPYAAVRFFPEDLRPDLARAGFAGWCAMISYFPEVGVLCLSFHYALRGVAPDQLIVLRQCGENRPLPFPGGDRSCTEQAKALREALGVATQPGERCYLCEITDFGGLGDPDEIERDHAALLYGLLSGDEGCGFVPESLVRERLKCAWGSRDFIRVYAFGAALLFLNLTGSAERQRYLAREQSFGAAAYGGCNDYFRMEDCPLTVNHGILFSVEYVMMLKALIDDVITYQGSYSRQHGKSFYQRIRATRDFRRTIILVLERAGQTEISEIGELSSVLLESQHIAPVVDQVKYLLELLEGDLNLMYSERNNVLITILTVMGLLLAAAQVLLAVL